MSGRDELRRSPGRGRREGRCWPPNVGGRGARSLRGRRGRRRRRRLAGRSRGASVATAGSCAGIGEHPRGSAPPTISSASLRQAWIARLSPASRTTDRAPPVLVRLRIEHLAAVRVALAADLQTIAFRSSHWSATISATRAPSRRRGAGRERPVVPRFGRLEDRDDLSGSGRAVRRRMDSRRGLDDRVRSEHAAEIPHDSAARRRCDAARTAPSPTPSVASAPPTRRS